MPVTIRPSTPADVPAIAAIYAPAVLHGTASFETDPPDATEMARRRAALVDAGFPWLVAEADGGEVVAYAYAGPYRPRHAYRYAVEDSIYVAPAWQKHGAGRALLAALIDRCETMGFRQMVAVIGDSASAGSIALHRALGFAAAGVVRDVGFKQGRWLDQVIMQRPLGPGARTLPVS